MKKALKGIGLLTLATAVIGGIAYCVNKVTKVKYFQDEDYDLDDIDEDLIYEDEDAWKDYQKLVENEMNNLADDTEDVDFSDDDIFADIEETSPEVEDTDDWDIK